MTTRHCPNGVVTRNGRDWPNNAVRCAVADLDVRGSDGQPTQYPEAMIFAGNLVKALKRQIGTTKLVMWRKKGPNQSDPYELSDMSSDPQAVSRATMFMETHPEFSEIPAPAPWKPSAPQQQQNPTQSWAQQQQWGQQPQYDYQPPAQQQWQQQPSAQQPQGYPQPGYNAQQPWGQPPQQQSAPQQQPSPWNTAAPPPGYQPPQQPGYQAPQQQQWGQQPQSFLAAAQGVPPHVPGARTGREPPRPAAAGEPALLIHRKHRSPRIG